MEITKHRNLYCFVTHILCLFNSLYSTFVIDEITFSV